MPQASRNRRRRLDSRSSRRDATPGRRTRPRQLGLESLEARQMLSASPTLVTTASFQNSTAVVGSAIPEDSAVLSGGDQESGALNFTLTAPDNSVVDTETITPNGDGTYNTSNVNVATQVGTYTWTVSFAGDNLNDPAVDQRGPAEQLTTIQASPTLVTTASLSAGTIVGSAIPQDSAVLSGGYQESGPITFKLTAPDNSVVDTETVTPNGDGMYNTSNVNVAAQVGTYTWAVSYAGDGLNNPANDQGGTTEQVTTVKASPTLATTASFKTSSNVVGSAIPEDSAVLSGGYHESGPLTFSLTAPNNTVVDTETVTPNGDGSYATSNINVATQVGTYTWAVNYAGDGLNNPANDQGGTAEQITTIKASPTISASVSETAGGVVGSATLSDSVTVSGGDNPTGTITFTLTAPNGTTSPVGTVAIAGDGTYNAPSVVATQVGIYTWHASYGGDGLNNGAIDNGSNESVTTIAASPTLVTSATVSAGNVVGSAIPQDSAVLTGGYQESGSLTFTLTAPNSSVVDTQTITPSGDGTYTTSNTNIATQAGTYTWTVSYAGDGLNNGTHDQGGAAEQVTTVKASPTLVSTASFKTSSNVVGTAIPEDSAVLSGGYQESGSLTFILTAPNNSVVDTQTITPNGDGTYSTTNATIATQAGTYTWTVSFAGDGLNIGAHDQGGQPSR